MTTISKPSGLTPEEFVIRAIERPMKSPAQGIHTMYSGFNAAFEECFPLLDPADILTKLAEEGKIAIRPAAGGPILFKAEESSQTTSVEAVLKKILE